jgi:GLPGLI family protein
MMKRFFSIIICLVFSGYLYGQNIRLEENNLSPTEVNSQDTLDFSKIRVHYQVRMVKDTSHPEKVTEDQLILQIGSKISKSSNYFKMISDSVIRQQIASGINMGEILQVNRGQGRGDEMLRGLLFKNYPEGKIATMDHAFTDWFYFEEDIPDFQWKLERGELKVLDYLCKKATITFRGRTYETWYAPEIPVSDGPWKFSGLPGLILKISDTRGQYDFEAIALSGVSWEDPITQSKSSRFMKTSRENFYKAKKRFMDNPATGIQNSDKIQAPPETLAKLKPRPYNPIELE